MKSDVGVKQRIPQLVNLSASGLSRMFDEGTQLFCYRRKRTQTGLENEGASYRYTAITLQGLHQFAAAGGTSPIDVPKALSNLVRGADRIDNIGDLGLLLWLVARAEPESLGSLAEHVDFKNALETYADARAGSTTEIAWFLTGLCYARSVSHGSTPDVDKLAFRTYEALKQNYGGKGIFRHMHSSTLAGKLRGRIGSFADQVYPIYALSKFGRAYENGEASKIAVECGEAICRLQGPLGQWWWHYDAATGRVLGRYPVYSVHQDGMAPMALFACADATGQNFDEAIYKGLAWIAGANELELNLVDESRSVIWRSFYRKKYKMYQEEALDLLGITRKETARRDLMVLYECRPYHLGWLLYAFADKIRRLVD